MQGNVALQQITSITKFLQDEALDDADIQYLSHPEMKIIFERHLPKGVTFEMAIEGQGRFKRAINLLKGEQPMGDDQSESSRSKK